jgi:hypothetical protein
MGRSPTATYLANAPIEPATAYLPRPRLLPKHVRPGIFAVP